METRSIDGSQQQQRVEEAARLAELCLQSEVRSKAAMERHITESSGGRTVESTARYWATILGAIKSPFLSACPGRLMAEALPLHRVVQEDEASQIGDEEDDEVAAQIGEMQL